MSYTDKSDVSTYLSLLADENIKLSTFYKINEIINNHPPQFFQIIKDNKYEKKLEADLNNFLPILNQSKINTNIIQCLKDKYGIFAQINFSPVDSKKNPQLENYSMWINDNTQNGFLTRLRFSSLLPYLFLDIQFYFHWFFLLDFLSYFLFYFHVMNCYYFFLVHLLVFFR